MPAKHPTPQLADNGFSLISDEKLLALYAALLKCRMLGRRMRRPDETSIAAAVGVATDLLPGDTLSVSGADPGPRFVKGASLRRVFSGLRARSAVRRPAPPSSVATALKSALRAARAHQAKKNTKVAVAFLGDPSSVPVPLRESLREAGADGLPILFVARSGSQREDLASFVPDSGFPAIAVDSNDVVAIYRVASEAIAHARRGNGPTLIECKPWRLKGKKKGRTDSIGNMEQYLTRKGLFTASFKAKVIAGFARELRTATKTNSVRDDRITMRTTAM